LGEGGWPLIIWEATTAKQSYYRTNYIKHVEKLGQNYPEKIRGGGLGKIWGPVTPGPNVEPQLPIATHTHTHQTHRSTRPLKAAVVNQPSMCPCVVHFLGTRVVLISSATTQVEAGSRWWCADLRDFDPLFEHDPSLRVGPCRHLTCDI